MRFKMNRFFIALLFMTGVMYASHVSALRSPQSTAKSLDIERYPHEPFELVDIKIGGQSVKDNIESKIRRNGEGLDVVKFVSEDGWFKQVFVRLRNVSDKNISAFRAYLYFKPSAERTLFSLPLVRSQSVKRGPLAPGEEIEIEVDGRLFDQTMETIRKSGATADTAEVTLAVESAFFSDELQWSRGLLLRKDPDNPLRWIPVAPAR